MPEPLLSRLICFEDTDPDRDGALNMAIDELLLVQSDEPWLRWFGWDRPTISIGYFTPASSVGAEVGGGWVRRWTGGGLVEHGGAGDCTFALGVPRSSIAERLRPAESYRWIHSALASSFAEQGVQCSLVDAPTNSEGIACFQSPVAADLVDASGRKLAGGAQRRSRQGFLHQGSVQGVHVTRAIQEGFARALAQEIESRPIPEAVLVEAEQLAEQKYRSSEWQSRV